MVIGHDLAKDRERFHVTAGGVVVIPKGMKLDGLPDNLPDEPTQA